MGVFYIPGFTDKALHYYKKLNSKKVICVDFDNTICLDEWPEVGPVLDGAIEVLKNLQLRGHKLILFTQRSHDYPICCNELEQYKNDHPYNIFYKDGIEYVDILQDAIDLCKTYGIEFWYINKNELWETLTHDNSRKIFADYYIDDHSIGMKYIIKKNSYGENCRTCDWKFIDSWCVEQGLYDKKILSK